MDILGLRIHSAIADCLEYIEKGHGVKLDLDRLPLDDPETFELIRSTETIGVFQVESPGQRNLLGRSQPEDFEDLIVEISLFRPGPVQGDMVTPYLRRRLGEEPITYPHPSLEPVLRATRGVLVYQEQVLQIAHVLAGFTPGEADQLRRAMTHDRSSKQMLDLRQSFIEGCLRNGVRRHVAEEVWEQVAAFASFGFCKAHACCFAKLAYQTAYLKAHYPAEFLAGIMTNQPMGFYPPWVVLNEAKRCGVEVLPPDINRSMARYSVEDGRIRVGLAHLKGMSERAMLSILEARKQGPFRSLRDFCERTNVPRPIIENLITIGAFRELELAADGPEGQHHESRKRLLWELAALPDKKGDGACSSGEPSTGHSDASRAISGRIGSVPSFRAVLGPGDAGGTAPIQSARDWASRESMPAGSNGTPSRARTAELDFDLMESFRDQLPDFGEVSDADRTKHDLDLMGIATEHHPLFFIRDRLRALGVVEAARLREFKDGDPIRVAGMVVSRNRPPTRSGQTVVFVTLEDETGVIEVVIFSSVYDRYGHTIYACPGLVIDGKLSRQGKLDVAVVADRVAPV
jgi:error-prone DNA polymerase